MKSETDLSINQELSAIQKEQSVRPGVSIPGTAGMTFLLHRVRDFLKGNICCFITN